MDNEEILHTFEGLLATSQTLIDKSEARIDKTNSMIQDLIRSMGQTHVEKEQQYLALDKRIAEVRADKEACIARYERKIDRLMTQCEVVQKQNTDLVNQIASKDRQIAKLESILLSQLSSAKVSIGELNTLSPHDNIGGGGK